MTVLLGVRPRAMSAVLGVERLRRVGEGGTGRGSSPPRPDDMALHCSMVSKLQEVTAEVTSLRQYSYAEACVGAATDMKAEAANAIASAAIHLGRCFILLSRLCCVWRPFGPALTW
jgi:hypothetical protein